MRQPIGGFFDLEIGPSGPSGQPAHSDAYALSNGRACFHVILEETRPRKVYVPFYCCDALLEPLHALNVLFEFYPISDQLEPVETPTLEPEEMFVYINYFGLKESAATAIAARYGAQAIVDNTHAFYAQRYAGAWSFNSVRKMFGAPDGGYLYAPRLIERTFPTNRNVHTQHLVARMVGEGRASYQLYRQSEAAQGVSPYEMSTLTKRLLASVDHERVQARRMEAFAVYDAALSSWNQLRLPAAPGQVPFCYPLLPERQVDPQLFHARHVYIPTLWKDVTHRAGSDFQWERRLAEWLLPLPVDHRLATADARLVVDDVHDLMRQS